MPGKTKRKAFNWGNSSDIQKDWENSSKFFEVPCNKRVLKQVEKVTGYTKESVGKAGDNKKINIKYETAPQNT